MHDPINRPEPLAPTEYDSVIPGPLALKAALDGKRDFLIAMPAEQVHVNLRLDAAMSAGIVCGALPRIAAIRGDIGTRFGAEGLVFVDDLKTVAYACQQAEIEANNAGDGVEIAAMHTEVLAHQSLLVTEADTLANRKLLDRARIEPGRPIQGYRTVVTSTLTLVDLYRKIWPTIEGKTFLTTADLDRIEQSAQAMLDALNAREHGSHRMPAIELRNRALSHLVDVYDEVRRMVTFVRWRNDDADVVAPSLYSARRNRNRSGSDQAEPHDPGVTPTPVPPTPMDPVPGSGPPPFTS